MGLYDSLHDEGRSYGPLPGHYALQASIPEEERCQSCEGLTLVKFMNSDFGPNQGQDWRTCITCRGTGRKDSGRR